ncbi:zinc finger MYM-type protein 2-like [Dysidea avara]|uniref:zinc finger MYM-type protein 2-like n=1 Tax=Dysidea avara TaxID=196820 RepID=UPI003316B5BC
MCSSDLFTDGTNEEICDWLCKFVSETCKADGTEYTPRSLYLLLSALQRHVRKIHPVQDVNFFRDPVFHPLKNVCDAIFKKLHSKGIGTETKATPAITPSEEDILWNKGIIGFHNPASLMNAVFFYNGKNFCLRGGVEHRNLQLSQVKREVAKVQGKAVACYVYSEFGSKNNQGGFTSLNQKNKTVRQYATDSERCHVKILDRYLKLLPPGAYDNDIFYLQPLSGIPGSSSAPWFKNVAVGRNTLGNMMKNMCNKAGISGGFTNHSLRAYGATALFQAKVPEKLIQQRTGHRSLESLRQYERTSESQLVEVSNVMAGSSKDWNPDTSSDHVAVSKHQPGIVSPTIQSSYGNDAMLMPRNPTFILNNCTFSGSSVSFAGTTVQQTKAVKEINEQRIVQETLQGVNMDDIFN